MMVRWPKKAIRLSAARPKYVRLFVTQQRSGGGGVHQQAAQQHAHDSTRPLRWISPNRSFVDCQDKSRLRSNPCHQSSLGVTQMVSTFLWHKHPPTTTSQVGSSVVITNHLCFQVAWMTRTFAAQLWYTWCLVVNNVLPAIVLPTHGWRQIA